MLQNKMKAFFIADPEQDYHWSPALKTVIFLGLVADLGFP